MLKFAHSRHYSRLLLPDYRVTDEALIAETAVWPNFFLLNVFFALKGSKLFIIICIFCAYTWTISGERLQDHWSSGLSIVLLRFISVIIQVFFGTQAPHILSAAVIRVGVNVAIKTELFYIVLTLQKHALHQ